MSKQRKSNKEIKKTKKPPEETENKQKDSHKYDEPKNSHK